MWAIFTMSLLSALPVPTKTYEAKLVECHDGDTCTFDLILGFGISLKRDVRFCEINAPELSVGQAGHKSKHWMYGMLSVAKKIVIHVPQKIRCRKPNRCEKMSFNRVMGWVVADDFNMNKASREAGQSIQYLDRRCGGEPE